MLIRKSKLSSLQLKRVRSNPMGSQASVQPPHFEDYHQPGPISNSRFVAQQRAQAQTIIRILQSKQIKLIAIDFDQTLISLHTQGHYQGSPENLIEYFRPTFHYLIEAILNSPAFGKTLHLCIVSFSPQVLLIQKLLQLEFNTPKTNRILVQCSTPSFRSRLQHLPFCGKEYHLSAVVNQITHGNSQMIQPNEILLIDDDIQNTRFAQQRHHHALLVDDQISLNAIEHFSRSLSSPASPRTRTYSSIYSEKEW